MNAEETNHLLLIKQSCVSVMKYSIKLTTVGTELLLFLIIRIS